LEISTPFRPFTNIYPKKKKKKKKKKKNRAKGFVWLGQQMRSNRGVE
jgi:hypothetical protein